MKLRTRIFTLGVAILLLFALCTATFAETTTTVEPIASTADSIEVSATEPTEVVLGDNAGDTGDAAEIAAVVTDVTEPVATEKTPEQIAAEEEALKAYKEQLLALQKSALNLMVVYGRITQEKADEIYEAYEKALEESINAIQNAAVDGTTVRVVVRKGIPYQRGCNMKGGRGYMGGYAVQMYRNAVKGK